MDKQQPFSYKSKKTANKVRTKRPELKQLRKELKAIGVSLTIRENHFGLVMYQLKVEDDTIDIIFERDNKLSVEVNRFLNYDKSPERKIETAIYQTMKYIAGVLNLDEIKADHSQYYKTFWFDSKTHTFTFLQENEQKQARIDQAITAINNMMNGDNQFFFSYTWDAEERVYLLSFENKIFNKKIMFSLYHSIQGNTYFLNDEAYTLEALLFFFKKTMEDFVNNNRIKLLLDQEAQINTLTLKYFNKKEAKFLLDRYNFYVANELTIISKNFISVFIDDEEKGIETIFVNHLSNGAILTYIGKDVRFYENMDAFLQEQKSNQQRYLNKAAKKGQRYLNKAAKEAQCVEEKMMNMLNKTETEENLKVVQHTEEIMNMFSE